MRAAAAIALVALVALLLQTAVSPLLPAALFVPDLLLVVCVYLGLHAHSPAGALAAFAIGYAEDAFSGAVLGLNAFAMTLVFLFVYLSSRQLWVDNTLSKVVLAFVAYLLKTLAIVLLIALFLSLEGIWRTIARYVLWEATLAAVLSPPIFALLSRMGRLADAR